MEELKVFCKKEEAPKFSGFSEKAKKSPEPQKA